MSNKSTDNSNSSSTQKYDPELVKELLLHFDGLAHQRINIFFLAEAIFFAALTTVDETTNPGISIAVSIVGLLVTIFVWITLRRLQRGVNWLTSEYKHLEKSGLYRNYLDKGVGSGYWGSGTIFTVVLPILFIVAWTIFLGVTLHRMLG